MAFLSFDFCVAGEMELIMVLNELYEIIKERKENSQEGSYTCYLFDMGLDKILKKVGEECSETIIAAKNYNKYDLTNEICDLTYHILVLMAQQDIDIKEVEAVLEERRKKLGNLKTFKKSDKET